MGISVVSSTTLHVFHNWIQLPFGLMQLLTSSQYQLSCGPPVVWELKQPLANGQLEFNTLPARLSAQRVSHQTAGTMSPFSAHATHVPLLHGVSGQCAPRSAPLVAVLVTDSVLMPVATCSKRNTVFTRPRHAVPTRFFDVPLHNALLRLLALT